MIYVDFDGVIMDTYLPIFKDYLDKLGKGNEEDDIMYVKNTNWNKVLKESEEIDHAFKYLKERKDAIILTRVYSMENEAKAKIDFLRGHNVENNIIFVPYMFKKTDIVSAYGNVLIDNALNNLDDFSLNGGMGIFFNKDGSNIDEYGIENTKYIKTKSLKILRKL